MIRLHRLVAPIFGAFLLAGCAGGPDHAEGHDGDAATAAVCVITGEDAEGGPTAQFEGHTVHFCCDNCKGEWDGSDDDARRAAIAKMK